MAKSAEACFEAVSAAMVAEGGVTQGKIFSAPGLKVGTKTFAMLHRDGSLVVKLPAQRVAALTEAGKGKPFEPMKGRKMKEWVCLPKPNEKEWTALAHESRKFVAAGIGGAKRK